MKILGFEITRQKSLNIPANRGGAGWRVLEARSGFWQRNIEVNPEQVQANSAVFSCQTLIASDISKLRVLYVEKKEGGIWQEAENAAFSPILAKPNHYQNRIQFFESWVLSKLRTGNTYVLKERGPNGRSVRKLHILAPERVQPLISSSGDVFYRLDADDLAGVEGQPVVPASEIMHDRFNCLFHPLVGLSPIYASGLTATQGLTMQRASVGLFQNGARPGGILTAPGEISDETAQRLKEHWEANYSGDNAGKIAVLGDQLKFEAMAFNSVDSQLVEQLRWTSEVVCSTYHVPPYKIGIGAQPSYNNVQALNTEYYSQCLQVLMESIELCLDEGLGAAPGTGTEFDTENLLRMDSAAQMDVLEKSKGKLTVNEQRAKLNQPPVKGGDTVYLQEQDHSLEWLARRDAMAIEPPPAPTPPQPQIDPQPPQQGKKSAAQLLGPDNFDISAVDERTIKLSFGPPEDRAEFELTFPVPVYRGVYSEGETYARGDVVTHGGSAWHCEKDAPGLRPGSPESGWRLMVKAGKNAKEQA